MNKVKLIPICIIVALLMLMSACLVSCMPTAKLKLDKKNITLSIGDYMALTPDPDDENIIWKSSNESVAKVTQGEVNALSIGNATIIAIHPNGTKATCAVKVTAPEVARITVAPSSVLLKIGNTEVLDASVYPENVSKDVKDDLKWKSDDNNVAKVDSDGLVTGVGSGTCKVICTAPNVKSGYCLVKVQKPQRLKKGTKLYCVNCDSARLYSSPSKKSKSLAKIKGSVLLISEKKNFYYVSYKGIKGYVDKDYFSKRKTIIVNLKPVIYLYPEKKTEVSVNLNLKGKLTCTYPAYNQGWKVTAFPNGNLIDKNGLEYNYLYWESDDFNDYKINDGFCIKGKKTAAFLEKSLEKLGLNRREINEFIVFWLPKMQNNPYNVISFSTEQYCKNNKLCVSPKPDTMIRVYMTWYPSDKYINIPTQKLTAEKRKGFTVVEWGGSKIG